MSKTKKIFIAIVAVLITCAVAFLGWWLVSTAPTLFDNTKYYSSAELEQAREDGYNAGVGNTKELESLVTSLNNLLDESEARLVLKDQTITILTNQNTEFSTLISSQAAIISSLNSTIEEMQTLLEETEQSNTMLLNSLQSLQEQVNTLTESNLDMTNLLDLNTTLIANLNNQIADLQSQITYLHELLNGYAIDNVHFVTFMLDNEEYGKQVVANGEYSNISTPANSSELVFVSWSLDGITPVDISTYVITENTTFIAIVAKSFDVRFKYDNAIIQNSFVAENTFASCIAPTDTNYIKFLGWSLNGVDVIDTTTYPVTENTTFIAVLEYSFDVTFKVGENVHTSSIVKNGLSAVLPTNPTAPANHEFMGWSLNGVDVIDTTTYPVTENTTFIAVFKAWQTVYTGSYSLPSVYSSGYGGQDIHFSVDLNTICGQSIANKKLKISINGWDGDIYSYTDYFNKTITITNGQTISIGSWGFCVKLENNFLKSVFGYEFGFAKDLVITKIEVL